MSDFCLIDGRSDEYRKRYLAEVAAEVDLNACFVISFPKSGRTWHRAMIGTYLAIAINRSISEAFNLGSLIGHYNNRHVIYSHNGANFLDGLAPDDPLVASFDLWRGRRVIFLIRDVRDVIVSAWHHARFGNSLTNAGLSAFIRHSTTGVDKVLHSYNRWFSAHSLATKTLIIHYEDMRVEPARALIDSIEFLFDTEAKVDVVAKAVEECQFGVMQKREREGFYKTAIATTLSSDIRAYKARAGVVGGYHDHLSAEDLAYIESRELLLGNPFSR